MYSLFGSIMTFGAMAGAITCGPIADFIGRKGWREIFGQVNSEDLYRVSCRLALWKNPKVMICHVKCKQAMRTSSAFCAAGWLAIYFAKVPVFIAEIARKNLRGVLTTLNQLMIVCGVSVSFIIGTMLSWRALALTAGATKIIAVGLMVCQQLGGINGVCFYVTSIFESAGSYYCTRCNLNRQSWKKTPDTGNLSDRESLELTFLLTLIGGVSLVLSPDKRVWNISSSGVFSCKSLFDNLIDKSSVPLFPLHMKIWKAGVLHNVKRRPYHYLCPQWCVMCKRSSESADHLFLHCSVAIQLWQYLFGLCDVKWVAPRDCTHMLLVKFDRFGGSKRAKILWSCITYEIALDASPIFAVTGILVYIGSFSIGMGAVPWVIIYSL
ncbi:unnamed protein product [Camellia sinensis]